MTCSVEQNVVEEIIPEVGHKRQLSLFHWNLSLYTHFGSPGQAGKEPRDLFAREALWRNHTERATLLVAPSQLFVSS